MKFEAYVPYVHSYSRMLQLFEYGKYNTIVFLIYYKVKKIQGKKVKIKSVKKT